MVLMTMIAWVQDGLPLAASVQDDEQVIQLTNKINITQGKLKIIVIKNFFRVSIDL